MINDLTAIIKKHFELTAADAGGYASMKISGMKFNVETFDAKGLGAVTVMTASGMLGLMKMDTIVINPKEKDLPLLSYDRILAMGNDTLLTEVYDTVSSGFITDGLDKVLADFGEAFSYDPGTHWYDDLKLPQSVYKKGKKKQTAQFDKLAADYLESYITAKTAPSFDPEVKAEKTKRYVDGLIKNGGPSTDVFKKALGEEKTAEFFHKVFFRTE